MRTPVDDMRLHEFMRAFGAEATSESRVYFTGGATALLMKWRRTTIDLDIKILPEDDRLLRAIPALKEQLDLNVELASPADFIPELPEWEDRSPFIAREGKLAFHHYDFYAQALAKIERGHSRDVEDVQSILRAKLIDPERLLELFDRIEPFLYRYPAISPKSFRRAVETVVRRE